MHPTTGTVLLARYKKTSKQTRKRTLFEIYSDLYYKTKFSEQVLEEFEETNPDYPESRQERSARKMEIYRKWREISWAAQDDKVKAHVQQVYNEEHGINQEEGEEGEANDDNEDVPSTSDEQRRQG